jgi:hypothetical protein
MRELIGITKHIVEPSFAALALVDRLAFAVEDSGELVQVCLPVDAPSASQSLQCAQTKDSYQSLRRAQCSDLFLDQNVAGLWLLRMCRWMLRGSCSRNIWGHSRCCQWRRIVHGHMNVACTAVLDLGGMRDDIIIWGFRCARQVCQPH